MEVKKCVYCEGMPDVCGRTLTHDCPVEKLKYVGSTARWNIYQDTWFVEVIKERKKASEDHDKLY